mmetsp:Transcript_6578/g.18941  ORF Transcript_6578/g.18941 Transcript_6578/m.18941 type:complete len:372 (+) Transcript_6578:1449-2564(+)
MQQSQLKTFGQARRESLHIHLRAVPPFWLQKDLMRGLVLETNNLVLNAGAVTRPRAVNPATVHGRLSQVLLDQAVRLGGGACQMARHLLPLHVHLGIEAEPAHIRVALLLLQGAVVHRAGVHAAGRAGLQPVGLKPQRHQSLCEAGGWRLTCPASCHALTTDPDAAVHKGACGDDGSPAPESDAKERAHPPHLVIGAHIEIHRHALAHVQIRCGLQHPPHHCCILNLVRLRPQCPDRGALGEVEHVLLQIAAVRHAPYLAPERINLVHKLRLGWPSHGRVARLPGNSVQVQRQQQRLGTRPGGCKRCLAPGVSAAHHHNIVVLFVIPLCSNAAASIRRRCACCSGTPAGSSPCSGSSVRLSAEASLWQAVI